MVGWLWLVVVGCGWLWLVVVGCGWLWFVVVGSFLGGFWFWSVVRIGESGTRNACA